MRGDLLPYQPVGRDGLPVRASLDECGETAQRPVSGRILGEKHEMPRSGVGGCEVARPGDRQLQRHRHSDHGLYSLLAARPRKRDRSVERICVGEGQVRQAIGGRPGRKGINRWRGAQESQV